MIAFISVLYVFAFIITYESLGMWRVGWENEEQRFIGGLFYSFWKKLALKNGMNAKNAKRSYECFGTIVAIIFYLLPLIGGLLWALWYLTNN